MARKFKIKTKVLWLKRIKPAESSILLVRRVTYLTDGNIIEYDKVLYRSDIFEYHVKLEGRGQGRLV